MTTNSNLNKDQNNEELIIGTQENDSSRLIQMTD